MGALALAWTLAAAALEAPSPGSTRVTLAAVGDIRLDGPLARLWAEHGPGHPSSAIRGLLEADILFGNLECPVTRGGEKQPKTWNFRAPPESLAVLKEAGFAILNLANNHAMDYGPRGLLDTLEALKTQGLVSVGAGENRGEAEALRVVEAKGLRVGFLGFTSTLPREAWAGAERPGVAYSDFARFPAVIRKARRLCDVLVVSFHGGTELAPEPNEIQKAFAHAAVDAGADVVLGHHPHVLQALDVYKGKPILYSLGNFLFVSPSPETRTSVIAKAILSRRGVERMDFFAVDADWGRPIPADPERRRKAYEAVNSLGALSAEPERFRGLP